MSASTYLRGKLYYSFTYQIPKGTTLDIPIAHKEGNYFCSDEILTELKDNNQIVFRYCDDKGNITAQANPNGSLDNIAGICDKSRRILGMMPHPERAATPYVNSNDGGLIFAALESYFKLC